MTGNQALLFLIVCVGCGSFLTLCSSFCSWHPAERPGVLLKLSPNLGARSASDEYVDIELSRYESVYLGFPAPIYHSSAAWWRDPEYLDFHAEFIWFGALLDVAFYSSIVGFFFWVGSVRARREKIRINTPLL